MRPRISRALALITALAVAAPVAALAASSTGNPPARAQGIDAARASAEALDASLAKAAPGEELLVFVHGDTTAGARTGAVASGLRIVEAFEQVGVVAALGTAAQIRSLEGQAGVTQVEADQPMRFFLDTSHVATRGEEVLNGFTGTKTTPGTKKNGPKSIAKTTTVSTPPLDGSGVGIAVIDSGIDGTHPFFRDDKGKSRVVRNMKLLCAAGALVAVEETGACMVDALDPLWVDATAVNDTDTPSIGGHGTHVAGIAGGGYATLQNGSTESNPTIHGAAPDSKLVGLSVGATISVYGGFSGLNWVLENHAAPCGRPADAACPAIKVINNSWGYGGEYNPTSLSSKLQDRLVAAGVTVVWAAGNDGGDGSANKTNPPGQSPTPGIISVANYNDDDSGTRDNFLASTSSRGAAGRPQTYPDLAAPGTEITSACRPYLPVCATGLDGGDPDYDTIGGTSMAAPHVAGIVAQLLELDPTLTPAAIENVLEDTAYKFTSGGAYEADLPDRNADDTTSFDKGHGLVDAKAAVASLLGLNLGETDPAGEPTCVAGGPVVIDAQGDAKDLAVRGTMDNEPALDLRFGSVADTGPNLVFTITVDDLLVDNPVTAPQISYNSYFTFADIEWYVDAGRDAAGGEWFSFGFAQTVDAAVTSAAVRAPLDSITGSFDAEADTIEMILPKAMLASQSGTAVEPGSIIGGFNLHSRRAYTTTPITQGAAADDALGSCIFTVPGEPVVGPPPPPWTGPVDGTVGPGGTYSWASGPRTDAAVLGCELSLQGCDERYIQLNVPETGGLLDVALVAGDGAIDLDLYVIDPYGNEIKRAATETASESIEDLALTVAGVYTIRVTHYLSVDGSYTGTLSLS